MGFSAFKGAPSPETVSEEVIESERSLNDPYWKGTFERRASVVDPGSSESSSTVIASDSKSSASGRSAPSANQAPSAGPSGPAKNQAVGYINRVGQVVVGTAAIYHGYKRNESIGWALVWGILGTTFWPIAAPIMAAQGFGQPKKK